MLDQKSKIKDQKQEASNLNSSSKSALTMADLMKSVSPSFKTFHKGDNVPGIIKKLTSSEILVDIEAKTEAVVLEKDKKLLRTMLSNLKVGDKVTVSVLNPESEFGNPVVSLRRYIDDMLWDRLLKQKEKRDQVDAVVNETTKGGFIVSTEEGVKGFMPNSYTTSSSRTGEEDTANGDLNQNFQGIVGKKIKVYILEVNKQLRKVIFSQKPVVNTEEFEIAVKNLKVDQNVEATISGISSFGIFISIPVDGRNLDGLIHISEISWDKVSNLEDMFTVGQKIEAVVIGIDNSAKRIDLSIKRLTADPFKKISEKYKVDQKVSGVVSEISSTGVSLDLGENGVEGFIRREKIPPTVTYSVGDKVNATVTQIDTRKRKILLVPVLLEKFVGYK